MGSKDFSKRGTAGYRDNPTPVCQQIEAYRKILESLRDAIEDSMTRVATNLIAFREMGWKRDLSPLIAKVGTGQGKLRLGDEPQVGLIVFGFDAAQRDSKIWKDHRAKLERGIKPVRLVGDAKNIKL